MVTGGVHGFPFAGLMGGGAQVRFGQTGQPLRLGGRQVALAQVQTPGHQTLPGRQEGEVGPVVHADHGPAAVRRGFRQGGA